MAASIIIRVPAALARLSARWVALIAAVGAVLFVVLRLLAVGGGPGMFVLAGQPWTDPATVPGGIPVLAGTGFDGQFFYRLAVDPATVGMGRAHGIMFDYGVRGGRIGYPLLAWLLSFGGRPSLVPLAMIAVNVLAVGALAYAAALLALDHGRAAAWGLAIAGFWGFGIVLGRDLSELVAAAAVFGGVLLVGRARYAWAGVALVLAVLTREQAVLAVAALAIGVLLHQRRSATWRAALAPAALVAVPAAVAFLGWQFAVAHITGELPATSSSETNSTWPFRDVWPAFRRWLDDAGSGLASNHFVSIGASLALLCFVALVFLIVWAVTSDGRAVAWATRPWELLLGVGSLGVLVCSTDAVLTVPADFRQSYEIAGSAWLVLWGSSGRRAMWALAVVLPVTVLALGFRCLNL
ncbi:MAG: hypothetical protein Q7V88_06090 [Actinomycetota bacterium]|nr:hypothetical protein [Actinomycetota bacterium]